MEPLLEIALSGAGLGLLGGFLRVSIGAFKKYKEEGNLTLDKVGLGFNLIFGGVAGGLATGLGLLVDPLAIILAGYGGADFLEGILAGAPSIRKKLGK